MNGSWLCSLTVCVSGSSFLLLQVVDTSFCCLPNRRKLLPKKLQSMCVNDTTEVLFTEKQANVMQNTEKERAP